MKPSGSTARPPQSERSEQAGKQTSTRKVSAANEHPARGERSEQAGKQTSTRKVSAANEQPGRSSRSGRAVGYSKPPLGRAEQRSSVRIKTLALFERSEFASVPNAASSARDRASGTDVARLFFGYFLLAKQKKVTRLPGRNPASHRSKTQPANPTHTQNFFAHFLSAKQKKVTRAAGPKPGQPPEKNKASATTTQKILCLLSFGKAKRK